MSRRWQRLVYAMSGEDGPGKRVLPLGEFLQPAPLAALALLAVNDHVLKGSGLLPRAVTGKLSDLAGLFFFPLLLTALGDTLLCGVARATGWRVDFSLRRWKLALAILATAAVFAPLELVPAWQQFYVRTLGKIGFPSETVADTSDLVALFMLIPTWFVGVRHIRRVPLGRLEVIQRARPHHVRANLGDAHAMSPDPHVVERLMATYRNWLEEPGPATSERVDAALKVVRYGP